VIKLTSAFRKSALDLERTLSFILKAMETLTVREASEFTGLSAHTLRYYERIGLIEPVARNAGGHRRYAHTDLEHLKFLHCLRDTGMPIQRMQEYATLASQGRATLDARLELLESHKRDVQAHIRELEEKLAIIDAKIERFLQVG
jgi:DNA-binding transcriptional MerR regulator